MLHLHYTTMEVKGIVKAKVNSDTKNLSSEQSRYIFLAREPFSHAQIYLTTVELVNIYVSHLSISSEKGKKVKSV